MGGYEYNLKLEYVLYYTHTGTVRSNGTALGYRMSTGTVFLSNSVCSHDGFAGTEYLSDRVRNGVGRLGTRMVRRTKIESSQL